MKKHEKNRNDGGMKAEDFSFFLSFMSPNRFSMFSTNAVDPFGDDKLNGGVKKKSEN